MIRYKLFSEDQIKQIASHYQTLLTNLCTDPNLPISRILLLKSYSQISETSCNSVSIFRLHSIEIDYISTTELDTILYQWNNTVRDYPWEETAGDIITKQCVVSPNNVALRYNSSELTYSQLQTKLQQLVGINRVRYFSPNFTFYDWRNIQVTNVIFSPLCSVHRELYQTQLWEYIWSDPLN